ncbi:MAG: hypothetical protein JWR68_733 [Polaromonas sp.]|nr:hypothetical protein [Polaromonas sp.]
MIISTHLVPKGFSACALWPFILVRPEHRHNDALIAHELVHYREQAWIMPAWVLLYLVSRRFRLAAEVRAYRRQIALGGVTREQAAHALLSYSLGISYGKAMQALA